MKNSSDVASIKNQQSGIIEPTRLPNGEKAVSVAFCLKCIIVLAESSNVFISQVTYTKEFQFEKINEFKIVSELKGKKIKQISGVSGNCLAVSEDGKVFGYGNNKSLSLGLNRRGHIQTYNEFTEVYSLDKYKITSAYSGENHSLFLTSQGKILASGGNTFGELATKENKEIPYNDLITETTINKGATFCIVGDSISFIFIDCDAPMSPNRRVNLSLKLPKQLTTKTSIKSITESIVKNSAKDEEFAKLKKENKSLKAENESLKTENKSLKAENESLKKLTKNQEPSKTGLQKMKASEMRIYDAKEIDEMTRLESIGRGGQSEVVKVTSPVVYAMKILDLKKKKQKSKKKSDTQDTNSVFELMKRFIQEYEIMNGLDHRNIVKTYGIFLGDETRLPCIILEFCPNNLCDVVEDQTPFEKVTCIYEISCAMKEVHSHGMIHRDLKPENILIDNEKHVKVSDFGVSCIIDLSTQSKTSGVGTLKFMAPELLSESTHYDEKVDVYSFGVVVFYILTDGELPKISITDTVLGKKAKIPSNINKVSRDLINRCWSLKADERPSFAEIVKFIESNKFKLIDGVEKKISEIKSFLSIKI